MFSVVSVILSTGRLLSHVVLRQAYLFLEQVNQERPAKKEDHHPYPSSLERVVMKWKLIASQ